MKHAVLIANRFLEVPRPKSAQPAQVEALATVLSNMAYFGFAPSLDALKALEALSTPELEVFWTEVEPAMAELTGDDRQMSDFVVYKNFPDEVLEMSSGQYWLAQIYMYLGAPVSWFAQDAAERPSLNENLNLKVLALSTDVTLADLYTSMVRRTARWTKDQLAHVLFLHRELSKDFIDVDAFGFKENGIHMVAKTFYENGEVTIANATDVLRLAAALSGQDASLRTKIQFKKFSRSERKVLLNFLDVSLNLRADMALRPKLWKALLSNLHPGDYKFTNVIAAYDTLYRGAYKTFNSEVEALLAAEDVAVLAKLKSRPGDFLRRLHKLYAVFGMTAIQAFIPHIGGLEFTQLLKLRSYLLTINDRKTLVYAPGGNWTKAVFDKNEKSPFSEEAQVALDGAITAELSHRMQALYPQGVELAAGVDDVKLQTNSQELAPYGRGTVFNLPEDAQFVRTASFWKVPGKTAWFDNGWNFFGENWEVKGSCCWNNFKDSGFEDAVFSGDPVNSKELEGRACQLIDLNLNKLAARGTRYAVWSILSYSKIPFSKADDVLATLQWGLDPAAGNLYEPARAQMVFPLKGDNLTKYVAFIDLVERKLVYLDANLYGKTQSATLNGHLLSECMPAMVEYLKSLPSAADYFSTALAGTEKVSVEDCLTGKAFQGT